MRKLFETIKIINGVPQFLEFHQQRLNHSRRILFNSIEEIALNRVIQTPPLSGVYRCRVIYSETIESVEYIRYEARTFSTFKVVVADDIDYEFKYLQRDSLNHLVQLKGQADDILIVKQGLVTDTAIANVAFWYQDRWLTPARPLLTGTTRERLLQSHQIYPAQIRVEELTRFSQMALLNAMVGFYVVEEFKI